MTAITAPGPVSRPSSLLANSAILSATMLAVSAGNYGLNVALARLLDPAAFGDANLAINLVLAAAIVAATLQLVASKAVASDPARRASVRRTLVRVAWAAGAVSLAVLGGGAWLLSGALNTSTPWMFVILGLGLPAYFVQAVHRGVLQGDLRIGRLALSYGIEGAVRVAGALALVWAGLGALGASIGIALSFIASGAVARTKRDRATAIGGGIRWAALRPTVLGATVLLAGQVLINNGDLFLSKAFFDPATAGVYASAALIGRAVFFFSWSVVHAVFPMTARTDASAADRRRAVRGALALITLFSAGGLGTVLMAGDRVASLLFGDGYAGAEGILAPYVLAASLFSVANLLASVDVSRGRLGAPFVLVGGAVLQTVVLAVAGRSPQAMVWLQVVAMAITAVAAGAVWHHSERKRFDNTSKGEPMNEMIKDGRPPHLSVVIPAYNEKQRIVPTIGAFTAHLASAGIPWELIIADDGSTDETVALVEMLEASNVEVLRADRNGGKGLAVRRGVEAARGELILFADADCSTPVAELEALTAAVEAGADVAVGSRAALGAEVEHRSALRRLLTLGLRTIVRLGLKIPVDDTQCGFKLFRKEAAKDLFAAQTIDGFSFDLEILFLAARRRLQIAEVPVRWFDAPGSKVDARREIVRFLRSVARIRWNALRGVYSNA